MCRLLVLGLGLASSLAWSDTWLVDVNTDMTCSQQSSFLEIAAERLRSANHDSGPVFVTDGQDIRQLDSRFDPLPAVVRPAESPILSIVSQLSWIGEQRKRGEVVHWLTASDPMESGGAVLAELAELAERGVQLHVYVPGPANRSDDQAPAAGWLRFHTLDCGADSADGATVQRVREIAAGILRIPPQTLRTGMRFERLGADSGLVYEINATVIDEFGVAGTIAHFDSDTVIALAQAVDDALDLQSGMKMKGSASREAIVTQRVYWATNRERNSAAAPGDIDERYLGRRRTEAELDYGWAQVSFPATHKRGSLEGPLFGLEFLRNAESHIVLRELEMLDSARFFEALNGTLADSGAGDWQGQAVVFVHGFNVPFKEAVIRTAQVAHDIEFSGAPILFSWPSAGSVFGYTFDREAAFWSIDYLERFLNEVLEKSSSKKVHLIAHSMGNQVLIGALQRMKMRAPNRRDLFASVTLAAPDYDAELFAAQVAPQVADIASNWTIYTSDKDVALDVSVQVNANRRLGQPVTPIVDFDVIDATGIEVSPWSVPEFHSYYATKMQVIDDIREAIAGRRASERELVQKQHSGLIYYRLNPHKP